MDILHNDDATGTRMVRLSENVEHGYYRSLLMGIAGPVQLTRVSTLEGNTEFVLSATEMDSMCAAWQQYRADQQQQHEAEQLRRAEHSRVIEDAKARLETVNMTYESQYSRIIDRSMDYERVLICSIAIDDLSAVVDAIITNPELFRAIKEVRDASTPTFKVVWLNNSNA